jgi:hypothetical protein
MISGFGEIILNEFSRLGDKAPRKAPFFNQATSLT